MFLSSIKTLLLPLFFVLFSWLADISLAAAFGLWEFSVFQAYFFSFFTCLSYLFIREFILLLFLLLKVTLWFSLLHHFFIPLIEFTRRISEVLDDYFFFWTSCSFFFSAFFKAHLLSLLLMFFFFFCHSILLDVNLFSVNLLTRSTWNLWSLF